MGKFKKQKMIVYRVLNLINNKVYIGQTQRTFNERYTGGGSGAERIYKFYLSNVDKVNQHLFASMKKYGIENFKVDIIKVCQTEEELNYWEEFFIALYNSADERYGYNVRLGGENYKRRWEFNWNFQKQFAFLSDEDKSKLLKHFEKLHNLGFKKKEVFEEITEKKVVVFNTKAPEKCWIYQSIKECCKLHTGNLKPHTIHIMCKQNENDALFNNMPRKSQRIYSVRFYNNKEELKEYEIVNHRDKKRVRINDSSKASGTKTYSYKKQKHEKQTHECISCGKKYKIVSKYCADCKRKLEEDKLKSNKEEKICPVCNKKHYRGVSPYCSSRCSNRARNARKSQKSQSEN